MADIRLATRLLPQPVLTSAASDLSELQLPNLNRSWIVTVPGDVHAIDDRFEFKRPDPVRPLDDHDGGLVLEDLRQTDRKRKVISRICSPKVDVIDIEAFGLVEIHKRETRARYLIRIVADTGEDPFCKKRLPGSQSAGKKYDLAASELCAEPLADLESVFRRG